MGQGVKEMYLFADEGAVRRKVLKENCPRNSELDRVFEDDSFRED